MNNRIKIFSSLVIIIVISVFFVVNSSKNTSSNIIINNQFTGGMPEISWQILSNSSVARNSNGDLKIIAALINEKNISLFYSIESSFESTPKLVGAVNSKTEQQNAKQPRITMIQTLNTLNKYTIGVIQLDKDDIVGQKISLSLEVANGTKDIWTVTPLKQVQHSAVSSSTEFLSFPTEDLDSVVEVGQLGGDDTLIKFKVSPPKKGSHASNPTLFFAMNRQLETYPITEVQFIQQVNSNQGKQNIPGAATPAPTQTQ